MLEIGKSRLRPMMAMGGPGVSFPLDDQPLLGGRNGVERNDGDGCGWTESQLKNPAERLRWLVLGFENGYGFPKM
jgi:hypothetical protein